jgi:hypothetical protein
MVVSCKVYLFGYLVLFLFSTNSELAMKLLEKLFSVVKSGKFKSNLFKFILRKLRDKGIIIPKHLNLP